MRYRWRAIYDDGLALDQFKLDGTWNKYTDIDRSRLKQFLLLDGDKPFIVLHLQSWQKLIYRMRVAMDFYGEEKQRVWLVGWHGKKNDINVQIVFFVFEDGHIEIVDRFREDHSWFYSVKFLPEEQI